MLREDCFTDRDNKPAPSVEDDHVPLFIYLIARSRPAGFHNSSFDFAWSWSQHPQDLCIKDGTWEGNFESDDTLNKKKKALNKMMIAPEYATTPRIQLKCAPQTSFSLVPFSVSDRHLSSPPANSATFHNDGVMYL